MFGKLSLRQKKNGFLIKKNVYEIYFLDIIFEVFGDGGGMLCDGLFA